MTDDSKVLLDKNKPVKDNKDTKNSSSGGEFHRGDGIKKKRVATILIFLYKTNVTERHGVKRYAIISSEPKREYRQTLQTDYN